MANAFRKIDYKAFWNKTPVDDEQGWFGDGQLRADALVDLRTTTNRLSIYFLDQDPPVSLDRIIGAVAANRGGSFISKIDYVLFDTGILADLAIEIDAQPGTTLDNAVNACHCDLVHLTAGKLSALGARMQWTGRIVRIQDRQVGRLINQSLDVGFIDKAKLAPELVTKLKEPKYGIV